VNTATKPRRSDEAAIDLLDSEERRQIAEADAELYAEILRDLGLENSSDVREMLVEVEYRRRIALWMESLAGPTAKPTEEILRDVAGAYQDFATRVDRERGHWQRKTQSALDIRAARGKATRQRVTETAEKLAAKAGVNWAPGNGKLPLKIIRAAAKEGGVSLSQARRILNVTK
jgi:hypothetical protein